MEGNHIVIKGRNYNMANLHQLSEELNGFHATSKMDEESIGFFGELNLFSNFHQCSFTLDNITYQSSEQYIQYQKAKLFGDTIRARNILDSEDAMECKSLAKNIHGFNMQQWIPKIKELCEPGILAKFLQNPPLLNLLLSTLDKELVECSYDKVWGNGIPLRNSNCLCKADWIGDNILGELIMSVRSYAKGIIGNNNNTSINSNNNSVDSAVPME